MDINQHYSLLLGLGADWKVSRRSSRPPKPARRLGNLLTYYDCYITNAVTEGFNSKIQSIKANARGFRNFQNYRIAILFHCGKLDLQPL